MTTTVNHYYDKASETPKHQQNHYYGTVSENHKELNRSYRLDEDFLATLGFSRLDDSSCREKCVFRYCNRSIKEKGFDLIFSEDYGVLTVEEFMPDRSSGHVRYRNTIVGMFHIESAEDLRFIFSRNVRLNYVFNTARKRVCYGE